MASFFNLLRLVRSLEGNSAHFFISLSLSLSISFLWTVRWVSDTGGEDYCRKNRDWTWLTGINCGESEKIDSGRRVIDSLISRHCITRRRDSRNVSLTVNEIIAARKCFGGEPFAVLFHSPWRIARVIPLLKAWSWRNRSRIDWILIVFKQSYAKIQNIFQSHSFFAEKI